jgi:hypothetical protein
MTATLMINLVGGDSGDVFPAISVARADNVHVPPFIFGMSQDFNIAELTNEHVASGLPPRTPATTTLSPSATPFTTMLGVRSVEIPVPLSTAFSGAAGVAGATVSTTMSTAGDCGDVFPAASVKRADIDHDPSVRVGKAHSFVDSVTANEHWTTPLADVAVTTAVSPTSASPMLTVGVFLFVTLSCLLPLLDDADITGPRVNTGAVVSTVSEMLGDAATIKPSTTCVARYDHVPSESASGTQDAAASVGSNTHSTFVPDFVNVTRVSIPGTSCPI